MSWREELAADWRHWSQQPEPYQRELRTRGAGSIDRRRWNLYLYGARRAYPDFGAHETTGEAVEQVVARCDGDHDTAVLVGHGHVGYLVTGGLPPWSDTEIISCATEETWRPEIAKLAGRIRELVVLGCFVGAGEEGARLLQRLACAAQCPVRAPTGATVAYPTGRMTLGKRARWQTGVCDAMSEPMPQAEDTHSKRRFSLLGGLNGIAVESRYDRLATGLDAVRFTPVGRTPLPGLYAEELTLAGDEAFDLVRLIRPIPGRLSPLAGIGAIRFGHLELSYHRRYASRVRYEVLGGGLLRPTLRRDLLYTTHADFFERLVHRDPQ